MANDIDILDGNAVATKVKSTDNAGVHTPHHNVDSSALPTGASSAANQTTIIGHLDGVEGLLTTMDADTGAIAAAVAGTLTVAGTVDLGATDNAVLDAIAASLALIDNAIATGNELQCDIVGALPAGTNNIGDMDILSIVPGTGATNLGKAVDSAAGSTDTGIAPLAIRDDALSALTPVEGDYVPLRVNSTGALHVTGGGGGTQYAVDDALGSTPTGTLSLAIRDDALSTLTPVEGDAVGLRVDSTGALWIAARAGSAEKLDDAAFTLATDSVVMIGVIRDDSLSTLTAVEGDAVPLRVSSTGALHVTGGGGGTEYTEDVATANPIVGTATMMERDDALSALTPIEGDWAAMRCDANGALWVACTGTVAVTGVSTAANQTTIIGHLDGVEGLLTTIDADTSGIITAVQLIDNAIVAHDAAISGATGVSVIGLNARSADPTAVASADATQALATLLGKQVVVPYAIPASTFSYASPAAVTDTADDVAIAAAGAGSRRYITGVQVFNGHDTVGTEVVIKSATTVLWRGWAEQTGGGCSARFDPPLRGGDNEAINVANITTGSSTYFNVQGYTATE